MYIEALGVEGFGLRGLRVWACRGLICRAEGLRVLRCLGFGVSVFGVDRIAS